MEVSIGPVGADRCVGPDTFLRGTRSRADTQVRPYAGEGEVPATTRASGAQRSVCASGCEEMGGNHGRDHPQSAYQHQTIPQSRLRRTSSLYTRGPWDGGYGLPRRFAPRNDSPKPLSFRGGPTGRRGNPSFLRWTGVRAAVPRAWPPPTKFRSEIWGVGQVVGPYGTKRKPAATAGAALSEAESAERGAGQIRFLPDTLRVKHGVQGSEVCGKPRPCSR